MPSESSSSTKLDDEKLQALEAKAVAEATATADAAFTPSPSLLNAASAAALLKQVDGPSLKDYEGKESIYVGRSVPIAAGGKLTVPISVTTPGSVVCYAVENKQYDISFGITAEREEGVTIVKESVRCDASETAVTGKFLVGSVPCLIQFQFDNEYSWMREKVVSYKVTITPPSRETLGAGRRRRAKACLKAVQEDLQSATKRLDSATQQRGSMEGEIEKLKKALEQKEKALQAVVNEQKWLQDRVGLRKNQDSLLSHRLENGWDDEKDSEQETAENGK